MFAQATARAEAQQRALYESTKAATRGRKRGGKSKKGHVLTFGQQKTQLRLTRTQRDNLEYYEGTTHQLLSTLWKCRYVVTVKITSPNLPMNFPEN